MSKNKTIAVDLEATELKPFKEMINHPEHYNKGIEVIKFTNSWNLNFPRGSVVKYICRGGYKDPETEIQDLEKAKRYIDFEIERIQNENN